LKTRARLGRPSTEVQPLVFSAVVVADVNGDGKPDLITANRGSLLNPGTTVSVLLGNGDGTFQAATNFAAGLDPVSVAVADLNGDGRPDLVVGNSYFGSNMVSVLLGNGNGTFVAAVNIPAGATPRAVALGDVNGDGLPDLAVANFSSASVSVLLGQRNSATHFLVSAPASVRAGVPFTITVIPLTAGNGVNCLYTGTATFSSSDAQAVLPANYTFTKADLGSHAFTVSLKTTNPPTQMITATDTVTSTITGTATVTVSHASSGAGSRPSGTATPPASGTPGCQAREMSLVRQAWPHCWPITVPCPWARTRPRGP
jgi:hypothetical protein